MAFNFNGNTPKEIKYNGNNVFRLIYNGVTVWLQKFLSTITGNTPITLTKATNDTLDEAKVFGKCEQRSLPKGYTELEYLESTGTQYIDTGVKLTNKNNIEIDVNITQSGTQRILGAYFDSSDTYAILQQSTGDILGLQIGNNQQRITSNIVGYNTGFHNIKVINKEFFIDNISYGTSTGSVTTSDYNAYMFAYNQTSISPSSMQIKMCKIWKNNVLVRNFIPARRNSDNVLGMYDTVTDTFFTNAGTGSFTAGAETTPTPDNPIPIFCNNGELKVKDSELPVGYKRVKDLIYDGNSYFITNYKLKGSDTLRFTFNASASGVNVMGCYNGADANNNLSYYFNTGNSGSYARYGSGLYRPKAQSLNIDYNVIFSPTGITGLDNNVSWQPQTFTSDAYFYIGWLDNASSSALIGTIKGNVKIDNTAKFIPCERLSDNALGYYDTYSNTFFENQGTGTLSTSGYDYTYTPEIYADGTVETVEVFGKNLFDTSKSTEGAYYNTDLEYITGSAIVSLSDYMEVEAGESYVFSSICNRASINYRINYFDSNKQIQSQNREQQQTGAFSISVTIPSGIKYVRISYGQTDTNVQFEKGSTATPYEPYFNGGTATCENLLSVANYKDVQEVISGSVTRNVGIKVLDGTEDWSVEVLRQKNNFYLNLQNVLNSSSVLCTIAKYATESYSYVTVPSCKFISKTFNIIPATNTTTFPTVASWEEYLADQYANGTPVILVYSLETPTTETVTGQTLTAQEGTNIVDSSLDNREMEITYYRTN